MSSIMDTIANETNGKSYRSHKYSFDGSDASNYDYDDHQEITWARYGETIPPETSKNLKAEADKLAEKEPLFAFFLDGSRHTYKVDDMAYKNKVFPVIAGQVGISCCRRSNREMQVHDFERRLVITLPKTASQSDWSKSVFFNSLRDKINENPKLIARKICFTDVIPYKTTVGEFERLENKGIAVVHDLMVQREISMVSNLVKQHHVDHEHYLLKDGSLEYRVDEFKNKRELREFTSYFRYVVGVSKTFNPENCKDKRGKNNSNVIANLPLFHRTPVNMYDSPRLKGMKYAVWYLRIRDKRFTVNAFDGILKIEKILVTDSDIQNGIETEEVDYITANLINERNPVCYGADRRWANHLYPVYVTESYAKSRYMSDTMFLNLF